MSQQVEPFIYNSLYHFNWWNKELSYLYPKVLKNSFIASACSAEVEPHI